MAAGCYNMAKEDVRLFRFFKDPKQAKVDRTNQTNKRSLRRPNDSSVLCSRYFKVDCFENNQVLSEQFGLGYRALKLRQNAVHSD